MKIGSLFSGYGGLDMAVEEVFSATTAWHCEVEPAPSKILAHHWPDVPNLGDITTVDWATVEPVDILCGGYPCQPFSHAGRRQGEDDERHLWPYVADALAVVRPQWAVFENVRGHLTLGFDAVLADMNRLGYSTQWRVIRAADVGAPHGRARIFILGENRERCLRGRPSGWRGLHRDSRCGRLSESPSEDRNDRQGIAVATRDAGAVWGEDQPRTAERPESAGHPYVAGERHVCREGDKDARTAPIDEGRVCPDRPRVRGHARQRGAGEVTWCAMDRADARSCGNVEGAVTACEPHRAGHCAACHECPRGGAVQVGAVVGARRESVRSGGVRGADAAVWCHGGWADLRAADNIAPHGRFRIFVVAPDTTGDGRHEGRPEPARLVRRPDAAQRSHASTPDPDRHPLRLKPISKPRSSSAPVAGHAVQWGVYEPAVRRWERLTRPAPAPTEPAPKGGRRLSPRFEEWMMGLPDGWVCDVPGVTRNEQMKALGNGVVPQQAAAAIQDMLVADEAAA